MKCKKCYGDGWVLSIVPKNNGECITERVPCEFCHGSGEMQMTNEEWFCSLPTQEKAKWLENKMTWAAQEQGTFTAKGWEMWLKQPHKESKSCQ